MQTSGSVAMASDSEPMTPSKTRFPALFSFSKSPSDKFLGPTKPPDRFESLSCDGKKRPHWQSLPSVVTWHCALPKLKQSSAEFEENNTMEETASIQVERNCSANNDVEISFSNLDVDQNSCHDSEKMEHLLQSGHGKIGSSYINGLKRIISRVFSVRRLTKSDKRIEELSVAVEKARLELADREEGFLTAESEMMAALMSRSEALDAAEVERKKWGWLTFSSTLREIDALKGKVQTITIDLEMLRSEYAVDHARLLSQLTNAEREYSEAKIHNVQTSGAHSKAMKSSNISRNGSWTVAKASNFFWTTKSSDSTNVVPAVSETFRNLPSVVTWINPRPCRPEALEDIRSIPSVSVSTTKMAKFGKMLKSFKSSKFTFFERKAEVMPEIVSPISGSLTEADALAPALSVSDSKRLPSVVTWYSLRRSEPCNVDQMIHSQALSEDFNVHEAQEMQEEVKTDILKPDTSTQDPSFDVSENIVYGSVSKCSIGTDFKSLPSVVTWHVYKPACDQKAGLKIAISPSTMSFKPFFSKMFRQLSAAFVQKTKVR
jgi:hypothetical protein